MRGSVVGCRILCLVLYIGSVLTEGNVKWDALSDGIFGVGDIFLRLPCPWWAHRREDLGWVGLIGSWWCVWGLGAVVPDS